MSTTYLILDNIRSLHNVGSMFRTADAFGVSKIYLCGYTGKPVDRMGKPVKEIEKTALGAEKTVPWECARNAWRVIEKLKKEGVRVLALENNVPGAISLYTASEKDSSFPKKRKMLSFSGRSVALIVGNEVRGLSKNVLQRADAIVSIPMHGKKESLNVAVACGVALYGLRALR